MTAAVCKTVTHRVNTKGSSPFAGTMSYVLFIQNSITKEVRECTWSSEWHENAGWWWAKGNGGCDCNRSQFFHDTIGTECDDDSCGNSRYSILKAVLPDGTEIQIDGNEDFW